MGAMLNLNLMGRLAADEVSDDGDYKALVCVFLQGGNDSFNMLVPRGESEYAEYADARGDLALPRTDLLSLSGSSQQGRELGLHPNLLRLRDSYTAGELAFVANMGILQRPISREDYDTNASLLPKGLFSHSDQQRQWQTGMADRTSKTGWLGRVSDLVRSTSEINHYASAISVNGVNQLQTTSESIPYVIGPNGSQGLFEWNEARWRHGREAVSRQFDLAYENKLQETFLNRKRRAVELNESFSSALEQADVSRPDFGANGLSSQLEMVYEVIQARSALGLKRQTFFVMSGGWDLHSELLNPHVKLLSELDTALANFQGALNDAGLSESVTTFTASDFGRSLSSNGLGSDHGWGGNQLVLGGAVNGQQIYGDYPDLYPDNPLDVGRGRILPTTSVDQYFAELACWFGISRAELPLVLPQLDRFYDLTSVEQPLGFMRFS